MVSSSLDTTIGKPPSASPLDLTLPDRNQLFLWTSPPTNYSRGDLWIDYPFSGAYNALGTDSTNPELAADVRTRLTDYVHGILRETSKTGVDEAKAKWAITELLTNATQYARLSETNDIGGLIRLEWRIVRDESDPSLALAVSNPCVRLFDPSRYARMSIADFYAMEPSVTNAHLGTIALVSFVRPHTHLSYSWELLNDEKILCSIQMIRESDADKPENFDELMKPVRVLVSKWSPLSEPIPYSHDDFNHDVSNGLATRTVSVSCVV